MSLHSNGSTTVPSAGTPAPLISSQIRTACHAFMVEALPTNVGNIYIGLSNMNKATMVGVVAVLAKPTANTIPSFSSTVSYAPSALDLAQIFIDADSSGDGVVASYVR